MGKLHGAFSPKFRGKWKIYFPEGGGKISPNFKTKKKPAEHAHSRINGGSAFLPRN